MKQLEQIPRNALGWMILCQALLVVPHVERVPTWVLLLYLAAFTWRVQMFRGLWPAASRWLKLGLIVLVMGGIGLSYGSVIGLEPTVALLLAAFALKLVETVARKDAYVVIFLGFFICITAFLFSQHLLLVLYACLIVWLLTTALVSLHRGSIDAFEAQPLKLAGVMLLQAAPLMLVLFFLFPRIGPLWNVPLKSHSARTGMSDYMRPGDVSRLTQSTGVALRASFSGEIPETAALYWRGLVMSVLDDDTWRSLQYYETPASERRPAPVALMGEPVDYTVIIEATQQNWLYGLRYAVAQKSGIMQLADYRLYSPVALENELRYRVRSWPQAQLELELSGWRRSVETRLPTGDNPRARQLARSLRAAAGSDAAYVERVLAFFREQPFRYTLQPPLLGANAMDQFLFQTQAGFCEHYAYAFAVLMRSVNIPARVVAGYQGGEVNPVNGTVIVHEFDAHAWNEVWLAGEGWVRVDPTGAVSPLRIDYGLEMALREEGTFLASSPLSPLRYRNISWVNALRLRYDALTYRWQAWVVGFDNEAQFALLSRWFGEINARLFIAVMLGAFAGVMLLVAGSLLWQQRGSALDPVARDYRRLRGKLRESGITPQPGEAPGTLLERAAQRFPAAAGDLQALAKVLTELLYVPAAEGAHADRQRELKRRIRALTLRQPGSRRVLRR